MTDLEMFLLEIAKHDKLKLSREFLGFLQDRKFEIRAKGTIKVKLSLAVQGLKNMVVNNQEVVNLIDPRVEETYQRDVVRHSTDLLSYLNRLGDSIER